MADRLPVRRLAELSHRSARGRRIASITLMGAPEALRRWPETNSAEAGLDSDRGDAAVGIGVDAPSVPPA